MSTRPNLPFIEALHGGYWNLDLKDFCHMINPYFPPQEILNKMAGSLSTSSRSYPSTNKHISLLISNYLNLNVDNIIIGNGASELINIIERSLITNLAIPIPTFDEYVNRLTLQGKGKSLYKIEKNNFNLDLDSFIKFAEQSNANAVLLVRPNNPTGNLISKAKMKYALEKLANLDVVLVDESFIEFSTTKGNASILDLINDYKNLIIIKSLGKVYGVPGLRLGIAISGNINRMDALREQLSIWNINSLAQYFIELLKDYQKEFDESCAKVIRSTAKLYNELSELECLRPYPTEANFILCKLTNNMTSRELVTFLFENFGFLIRDCGTKPGLDSRFIRIASRTDKENENLISAIKRWEESKR